MPFPLFRPRTNFFDPDKPVAGLGFDAFARTFWSALATEASPTSPNLPLQPAQFPGIEPKMLERPPNDPLLWNKPEPHTFVAPPRDTSPVVTILETIKKLEDQIQRLEAGKASRRGLPEHEKAFDDELSKYRKSLEEQKRGLAKWADAET